jgi:hypothetical protein
MAAALMIDENAKLHLRFSSSFRLKDKLKKSGANY